MYFRGPARRYLLPEARGAEMPDHGQLQVDEQGDGYQLRATDMVERIQYKEDVYVTRLRCQDGALCREGKNAVEMGTEGWRARVDRYASYSVVVYEIKTNKQM